MQDTLTHQDYRDRIELLAEIVLDEHGARDDYPLPEVIFDVLDGDQYTIYSKYYYPVLYYSEHDAEAFDHFGVPEGDDWDDLLQRAVFEAMRADVRSKVADLQTED